MSKVNICMVILVVGIAVMVSQFQCTHKLDEVVKHVCNQTEKYLGSFQPADSNSQAQCTDKFLKCSNKVAKHLIYVQGNDWHTNHVCYGTFVDHLKQLGLGWKSYVIAADIMKVGGDKTNDAPWPWWKFVGPWCVYRPNILHMIHTN